MIAALKVAMRTLADKYGCNAAAIQCWNALQSEIGIMPCAANSLMNEEGFPVVCETDIHGAITAIMLEAAGMDTTRTFFADWTVRHPDNENGELLQHCGPWPISCAACKPTIGYLSLIHIYSKQLCIVCWLAQYLVLFGHTVSYLLYGW